jgi:DNA-binding transcriptional MerR regulator
MKNQKPLLIGDLAKQAGVKADTIRFYEKRGLLPRPGRATSGYRTYDEPALKQLRFIRQAQSLGFSLHEIKRILKLHGAGKTTCRCVMAIAEATLSETESKLKELRAFRDALKQQVERWRRQTEAGGRMAAEFCALIESSAGLRSAPDAVRPVRVKRSASS